MGSFKNVLLPMTLNRTGVLRSIVHVQIILRNSACFEIDGILLFEHTIIEAERLRAVHAQLLLLRFNSLVKRSVRKQDIEPVLFKTEERRLHFKVCEHRSPVAGVLSDGTAGDAPCIKG